MIGVAYTGATLNEKMAMPGPAHFANILTQSPFSEMPPLMHSQLSQDDTSSPTSGESSDVPRYFSERDEDDHLYAYSSPPSTAPHHQHYPVPFHPAAHPDHQHRGYEAYPPVALEYNSSPLAPSYHYPGPHVMHYPHPYQHLHHEQLLPYPGMEDGLDRAPMFAQAPPAKMIPGLYIDRPEIKRRRTCPDMASSSPIKKRTIPERRGAGKDGEDVWPEDVEISFFESIRLVPKLGRKKIIVNGKPCGRNELIGDYIRRKTGKLRSRKQVSSHIQVLKNIRRDDLEFMDLVAEPKTGEMEDDFTDEARRLFFLPQEFAHIKPDYPRTKSSQAASASTEEEGPARLAPLQCSDGFLSPAGFEHGHQVARDGLLSPYSGAFFAHSPSSGSSSPALSSTSMCSTRSVSPYPMTGAMTPSTEEPLTSQVFNLKLAPPTPQAPGAGVIPSGPLAGPDTNATPKGSPSKLGHRRAASRGLVVSIPRNAFGQMNPEFAIPTIEAPDLSADHSPVSSSQPHTPWPQMMHTPTCPPPAPAMLSSPSQRQRLSAIWAETSADWNKSSPALERSFDHELSAAVASSREMQSAAARSSTPLKRSFTDGPMMSSSKQIKLEIDDEVVKSESVKQEDPDFFINLLGSREV